MSWFLGQGRQTWKTRMYVVQAKVLCAVENTRVGRLRRSQGKSENRKATHRHVTTLRKNVKKLRLKHLSKVWE